MITAIKEVCKCADLTQECSVIRKAREHCKNVAMWIQTLLNRFNFESFTLWVNQFFH